MGSIRYLDSKDGRTSPRICLIKKTSNMPPLLSFTCCEFPTRVQVEQQDNGQHRNGMPPSAALDPTYDGLPGFCSKKYDFHHP